MVMSFVLSFFPLGVLDEIFNLIESVSEGFPSYSSMYFYGSNLDLLARGHLGPWDLHFNKLGRGNATYQIAYTGPGVSREDFFIYFYAFLWFENRTPWRGAILDHGIFICSKLVKGH